MRLRTFLAVAAIAQAPLATAGGMRDLADAWLLPVPALRALMPTAADTTRDPGGWSLAVAQGRLFGLDSLPQLGVAVARRWPALRCRLRWERLGARLYREDQARLEIMLGRRWCVGGAVGLDRLSLAGDPSRRRLALALRVDLRPGPGLRLEGWWPLTEAPPWYGRQGLRRWLRLSGRDEGWAWAVVVDRRAEGDPVLQAEMTLRLATAACLGLRVEPWSGAAGPITAWRLGGLLLRSSHLAHPELGITHRWGLVLGADR